MLVYSITSDLSTCYFDTKGSNTIFTTQLLGTSFPEITREYCRDLFGHFFFGNSSQLELAVFEGFWILT